MRLTPSSSDENWLAPMSNVWPSKKDSNDDLCLFNLVFLTDCSREIMLLGYFLVGCGCRPAENISLENMNKFCFQEKISLLYWKAAIITSKKDACCEPFNLKIFNFGFFSCLIELVRKHRKIYFGYIRIFFFYSNKFRKKLHKQQTRLFSLTQVSHKFYIAEKCSRNLVSGVCISLVGWNLPNKVSSIEVSTMDPENALSIFGFVEGIFP